MNKFAFAALAAVAALILGFGSHLSVPTTHAKAVASAAVPCEFLASAIDGNLANATTLTDVGNACNGITAAEVANLAAVLGNADGVLTASDLTDLATEGGNQVQAGALDNVHNSLVIFAFVNNIDPVTIDSHAGLTTVGGDTLAGFGGVPGAELCTTGDDKDCDTSVTGGDGVVTANVMVDTAVAGNSVDVVISQSDDATTSTQTINVVGGPNNVSLAAVKDTIQTSASSTAFTDCKNALDVTDATNQLSDVDKTLVVATTTDSDGTKLTRVGTTFSSGSTAKADNDGSTSSTPDAGEPANEAKSYTNESVDAGTAGVAAFSLYCGGTSAGTAKITAQVNINPAPAPVGEGTPTPTPNLDSSSVTLTVVGGANAIALTASPAQIACDGTQTATITAKATDSAGNNVADGTKVNFSVVALGTANPINVKTVGGEASSTITPLSGSTAGVTVIVTSGDAQSSIRVDCSLPVATPTSAAPAPTATPKGGAGGTIGGPDTGTGGYIGQDGSASFPLWTLIALAMGSVALVGGSVVARRSGK